METVPKWIADEMADLLNKSLSLNPVVTMTEIETVINKYQKVVDEETSEN